MRVYLCTGEASGDRLGESLVAGLRARVPGVQFRGVPGPRLRAAGVETVEESERFTAIGPIQSARALPSAFAAQARLERDVERWAPNVVVTVDSPAAWLPFARRLRQKGLRTLHWVSPQVWAWRPARVRRIAESVDALLCLFPFEPRYYQDTSVEAVWTGHPLVDARSAPRPTGAGPVFGFAPGSRKGEVQALWPMFRSLAAALRRSCPQARFVVPVAPTIDARRLTGIEATFTAGLENASADVWIACTGTATLELAARGEPMIAVYRTDPATYAFGRAVLRVPHLALPNLLAERQIVPEFIQRLDVEAIAAAALELLGAAGQRQRAALLDITRNLRDGAREQAADVVLRWAA